MPSDPSEDQTPMLSSTSHPLSHSPLPSPSSSPTPPSSRPDNDVPVPPWVRPSPQRPASGTNARRLSTPYSRSAAAAANDEPLGRRLVRGSASLLSRALAAFYGLSPAQRVLAGAALVALNVVLVLFLVYSHRIFAALAPVAAGWRALPGGWVLAFLATCAAAFPPVIGYSTAVTVCGFVYGFPGGWSVVVARAWPIAAGATVFGSTAAFLASRTVFSGYVHATVGADRRFVALGQVLRRDGLFVLAAIRFCPLPFSLSNGFLATIPSITPLRFALATALSTPKLLVHVFIGSRLALLAESGDSMSVGDKVVNYLSMLFGSVLGMALGLFIYRRTMARAKELAREEAAANGLVADGDSDAGELDYADLEEGILGARQQRAGEADEAALMDGDDISLWETDAVDGGYRDDDDVSEGVGGTEYRHGLKGNLR
ncbi:hypothetical protein F4818DRAFT_161812 [Hypoxylon cercidicola]|nr:hypothetical protein F4818DRAFT_161812 [Hypoxylon cercidicola]